MNVFTVASFSSSRDHPASFAVYDCPDAYVAKGLQDPSDDDSAGAAKPTGEALARMGRATLTSLPGPAGSSSACRCCKASLHGPRYSQLLKLLRSRCTRRVTMLDLKMAFLKLVNNMLVDRSSRLPNSYLTAKSNQLLD